MRKTTRIVSETNNKKIRPALTPEARENQMISLAIDLAEKQLLDGTASSQVITHYLKLGSSRERLEQEIMQKNKELIEAKKDNLESSKHAEELYINALNAMKKYSGNQDKDINIDQGYIDDIQ